MRYINIQTDAITSFVGFFISPILRIVLSKYIDISSLPSSSSTLNTYRELICTVFSKVDGLKENSSVPKSYTRMDDLMINAERTIDESPDKEINQYYSSMIFTHEKYISQNMICVCVCVDKSNIEEIEF